MLGSRSDGGEGGREEELEMAGCSSVGRASVSALESAQLGTESRWFEPTHPDYRAFQEFGPWV